MVGAGAQPARVPLDAWAGRLRCPNCDATLIHGERILSCVNGHSFDIAREGRVALVPPRRKIAAGDTLAMVLARETFLGAGHYAPIARSILTAARESGAGRQNETPHVVDLGAGTGYYLAALLGEFEDWCAVALDASNHALRRALRAHPRIAAVTCDVWQQLPLTDHAAEIALNVFAPRNPGETARVLTPRGALIVVTPTARHLHELVPVLGMLGVQPDKQARLHAELAADFRPESRLRVEFELALGHADIAALVAMGPSAHHLDPTQVSQRLMSLGEQLRVSVSVNVETFRAI